MSVLRLVFGKGEEYFSKAIVELLVIGCEHTEGGDHPIAGVAFRITPGGSTW